MASGGVHIHLRKACEPQGPEFKTQYHQMELGIIILNEISQAQKTEYHMLLFIWGLQV
jgi:hypothetical protein